MRKAAYEPLEDGEGWYAHIPGIPGLWATGACVEDARNDLFEALDEWLYVNGFISQLPRPQLSMTQ
jgi:predicted RNase H-like HicB family nuclease